MAVLALFSNFYMIISEHSLLYILESSLVVGGENY